MKFCMVFKRAILIVMLKPDNLDSKVKAAIDDLKTIALDVASLYKDNPK